MPAAMTATWLTTSALHDRRPLPAGGTAPARSQGSSDRRLDPSDQAATALRAWAMLKDGGVQGDGGPK